MIKNRKFNAFTLAEVLITLTIIGVIAAITIPNLVQSYKKHQVEVGVKEAYSILNNAILMAKAEYGSIDEIIDEAQTHNSSDKEKSDYFTNTYLKPYLKYSKSCDRETSSTCKIVSVDRYKKLDGTTPNLGNLRPHYWSSLALNNGMLLGVIGGNGYYPFIVDINGGKGPNQVGVDLFYFGLSKAVEPGSWSYGYNRAGNGVGCGNGGALYDPNSPASWNVNKCDNDINNGYDCSCAIMMNGWKIPDDYPVKKF